MLQTKTSTRAIAFGFAIGSFISILPTTGFGFVIGLLVVAIFKKISKYGLFLAMIIWNPLTVAPLYVLSYQIGDWLIEAEAKIGLSALEEFIDHSKTFILGNLVVNGIATVISYLLIYLLVKFIKSRRTEPEKL